MVTTGTHYGLVSIGINNRMTIGYDTIAQPGAFGFKMWLRVEQLLLLL